MDTPGQLPPQCHAVMARGPSSMKESKYISALVTNKLPMFLSVTPLRPLVLLNVLVGLTEGMDGYSCSASWQSLLAQDFGTLVRFKPIDSHDCLQKSSRQSNAPHTLLP